MRRWSRNGRQRLVVVVTGAGISAKSGLPTFRGSDGLWLGWRLEDVATAEAFARQPDVVQRFYDLRRRQLLAPDIAPNPAHHALAELERRWPGPVQIVTQNIDDLHERAGSENLIHMHGELLKARCTACAGGVASGATACRSAPLSGMWWRGRPAAACGLVWRDAARAGRELRGACGLRSLPRDRRLGQVYPAAGFFAEVRRHGRAHTVKLNLEPSAVDGLFAERRRGPASEMVPRYIDDLLATLS